MIDKSLELLTEEELYLNKRFEECKTIEELKALEKEINVLYENNADTRQHKQINMSLEEFKKKYDLVDIRDLKGKYGF